MLQRLDLERRNEDLLVALLLLAVGTIGQLADLVGHQMTALRKSELLEVEQLLGSTRACLGIINIRCIQILVELFLAKSSLAGPIFLTSVNRRALNKMINSDVFNESKKRTSRMAARIGTSSSSFDIFASIAAFSAGVWALANSVLYRMTWRLLRMSLMRSNLSCSRRVTSSLSQERSSVASCFIKPFK